MEIQSNYGNTNYTSMNEVAFAVVVPEPSSLIQVGLAAMIGLGVWLRRRALGNRATWTLAGQV